MRNSVIVVFVFVLFGGEQIYKQNKQNYKLRAKQLLFILKLEESILTVSGSTYYSVLLAPKRSKKSDVKGGKTEEKTKSDQQSQVTKKLR